MDNFYWIIPVIGLAVWILSQLVGKSEEPKRPAAGGGQAPQVDSEVQRFLDEINRRRQKAEGTQAEQRQEQPIQQVQEPPRPKPEPPRRESKPTQAPRPAKRRAEPRMETIPAVLLVAPPKALSVQASDVAYALSLPALPAVPTFAPTRTDRPGSPAVNHVRSMMKSQAGLQACFLLQEILGPPRCRRKR